MNGSPLRLFCFPPAGTGSGTFDAWAAELPDSIAVTPVRLPGHHQRGGDTLFTRLPPLADLLVHELMAHLDGPFALFGHSMGALIAFEVARGLRSAGAPEPCALYVSGFRAPHLASEGPPIHALPDDLFVDALRPIGEGFRDVLADTELRELVLPVLRADIELCESYRHRRDEPLRCPIRVFGGRGDDSVRPRELDGWRRHTRGPFRLQMFPGDHSFPVSARSSLLRSLRTDLHALVPDDRAANGRHRRNAVTDPEADVLSRLEGVTATMPDAVAFTDDTGTLTFAELTRQANQLAHHLAGLGVGPEVPVAVCLDRSCDVPVTLLAVWKAGGCWLPLDPAYPADRLRFMLDDARAPVLVTTSHHAGLFSRLRSRRVVCLDRDAGAIAGHSDTDLGGRCPPGQLACVVYTSGSTGRPKGVALEHRQILSRLTWMWEAYPFGPDEIGALVTATSFVDSLWELLGALLCGRSSVIVALEQVRSVTGLIDRLAAAGATRVCLVPSLLRAVLDLHPHLARRLPRLCFWVSTGETLPVELYERFRRAMPHATLHNVYGTSEVWDAMWYDPGIHGEPCGRVPIGRPLRHVQVQVVDQNLQPVPAGVTGELCVGGEGVARGYLHLPDLTAERFVPHPFEAAPGERLYRTGDRARQLPNGTFELIGRQDDQLNVRGFRIERGEVETHLRHHPAVREAAVTVTQAESDDARLVAYLVPRNCSAPTAEELREHLAGRLPGHCVPSAFICLDELPLTPSGKVDYRSLSAEASAPATEGAGSAAPHTGLESVVAGIWEDLLGTTQIGLHDDFFSLGGHSLLAATLVGRLRTAFGVELTLRRFLDAPTVAGVAGVLVEGGVTCDDVHNDGPSRRPTTGCSVRMATAIAPTSVWRDLDDHLDPTLPTPRSVLLSRTATDHWAEVQAGAAAASTAEVAVTLAYSIKTNPEPELLRLARSSGMLVEAISQLELRKALDSGFPASSVVLNGPGKWWPARIASAPLRAIFCDSLVELDQLSRWLGQGESLAGVIGVRLRPPGVRSRFGIDVCAPGVLEHAASAVRRIPADVDVGVHFHLATEQSSSAQRWSIIDSMLVIASQLERASGRAIRMFDIGGGWAPDAFVSDLLPGLGAFAARALAILADVREIVVEPGRGLAEPTAAMLTRVLEVRPGGTGGKDVVVDTAVSELPEIARHSHRMFVRTTTQDAWRPVEPGVGEILGRSCMESDVLATGVALPEDLAVGDYFAICDAGAYDASKSFAFGRG